MTNTDDNGWDMDDTAKRVEYTTAPDDSDHPWYDGTEGGYIVTDSRMIEQLDASYVAALIEKYGDISELTSTVTDDMDDFGPAPDYSDIDPEFYGYHPE